jgi:hypothetical protein
LVSSFIKDGEGFSNRCSAHCEHAGTSTYLTNTHSVSNYKVITDNVEEKICGEVGEGSYLHTIISEGDVSASGIKNDIATAIESHIASGVERERANWSNAEVAVRVDVVTINVDVSGGGEVAIHSEEVSSKLEEIIITWGTDELSDC